MEILETSLVSKRPRRVILTSPEQAAHHRRDALRDAGATERDAAEQALASMLPVDRSAEFVDYLSDGALTLGSDGRVLRVGQPVREKKPPLDAWSAPMRDGRPLP